MRRVRIGGQEFVHIEAPAGYSRELPAWMLQPAVCTAMELGPAQLTLSALLRFAEVVQSFLASGPTRPAQSGPEEGTMHGTTARPALDPGESASRDHTATGRTASGNPQGGRPHSGRPVLGASQRHRRRRGETS